MFHLEHCKKRKLFSFFNPARAAKYAENIKHVYYKLFIFNYDSPL